MKIVITTINSDPEKILTEYAEDQYFADILRDSNVFLINAKVIPQIFPFQLEDFFWDLQEILEEDLKIEPREVMLAGFKFRIYFLTREDWYILQQILKSLSEEENEEGDKPGGKKEVYH